MGISIVYKVYQFQDYHFLHYTKVRFILPGIDLSSQPA